MATGVNASVVKAFGVLALVNRERPEITAPLVRREMGLNAATAHRFLVTLESLGMLVRLDRGRYVLGPQLADLGRTAEDTNPIGAIARPVLRDLSAQLGVSTMIGRLSGDHVVCLATELSADPVAVHIRAGAALDLHATAQGKLWLAFMEPAELEARLKRLELFRFSGATVTSPDDLRRELWEIRERGWALNAGEREPDVGAVSVPIFAGTGRMFLSLSAYFMIHRLNDDLIETARASLAAASDRLRHALNVRTPERAKEAVVADEGGHQ